MALVKCPECGTQVSTAASACPKCGAPIATSGIGTPLSTIQQTSKRLKVHIIFSSLAFWFGLIWLLIAINSDSPTPSTSPIPVLLIIIGLVWFLITKLRIWWHHK